MAQAGAMGPGGGERPFFTWYEWVKHIPVARRVPEGFTEAYRARDKMDVRSRNSGLCARVVQSWGRPRIAMDLESGSLSGRPSGPPG